MSFNELNDKFASGNKDIDYLEGEKDSEKKEHHDGQEQQADRHT